MILTIYFMAVVSSFYHELVAPSELVRQKEKAAVTFSDKDASVGIQIEEETVLVSLETDQDTIPTPAASLPAHPHPDEVITLPTTNPFANDIFENELKVEADAEERLQEKPAKSKSGGVAEISLKANFTPFKTETKVDGKTPAKMKVFLPGAGGDESDFDFSFTDPDFDSSLCVENHPGVEDQ